jgi:hypothetical protein
MSQKTENTQPVGNTDKDNTVLGETRTIEIRRGSVATIKFAAMDPHHDRALFGGRGSRSPDIQIEAILA